ncbi:MAG: methyltransferase domain-containing protein [Candidatus Promineifilaceae bacterium]|nr:methyltransferase domain-containing protein [Candidatus Promineifilaceae bacterium]
MSLRFHEIAERRHRILNPFTEEQLSLLGDICRPHADMRHLDLACGKGEMLCRWSARSGLAGVGVDISKVFLEAARQRAAELKVADQVTFIEANASSFPIAAGAFDIVSCIGATWIGDGLVGTLEMMRAGLRDRDSLLLVGEPYWIDEPPEEAVEWIVGGDREAYTTLGGTLQRIESTGLELVEMVIADHYGWDRYVARQWISISDWLREHPDDPQADELRQWYENGRREYLTYGRRYFGWGVFVLRPQ